MFEVKVYNAKGDLKKVISRETLIRGSDHRRKAKEPGTSLVLNKKSEYTLQKDGTQ